MAATAAGRAGTVEPASRSRVGGAYNGRITTRPTPLMNLPRFLGARLGRHTLAPCAALLLACAPLPVLAAADGVKPTSVEFSVEAQSRVDNDLVQATVFAEVMHAQAGEAARQVSQRIADALGRIKAVPGISARTQGARTLPVYAKGGRDIEAWRSRTELVLETDQVDALAKLLGQLQNTLAIGGLSVLPKPAALQAAEDRAIDDALRLLMARAERVAQRLGKSYRLAEVTIGSNGHPQPRGMATRMLSAEAVAMPIEAGESTVSVPIRARIELID